MKKNIETMDSYQMESLESRFVGKVEDAIECAENHLFPNGNEKVTFGNRPVECYIDQKTTRFVGVECNDDEGIVLITDRGERLSPTDMTIWENVEVYQRIMMVMGDLRRE